MRESMTTFFSISDNPGRARNIFDIDANIADTLLARFYQSSVDTIKVRSLSPASKNRRQELGAARNTLHIEHRLTRSQNILSKTGSVIKTKLHRKLAKERSCYRSQQHSSVPTLFCNYSHKLLSHASCQSRCNLC